MDTLPVLLLETLRAALDARAAGWWGRTEATLVQLAFTSAADLPTDVAEAFARATRSVPLSEVSLGIVKAAIESGVAASHAAELPPTEGSGLWLRRFAAERSVAVACGPIGDDAQPTWVVSVALAAAPPSDAELARRIREATRRWTDPRDS
ncbi:MAG: hypothetical protein U0794_07170 [Isosphaeraceae bacterium]